MRWRLFVYSKLLGYFGAGLAFAAFADDTEALLVGLGSVGLAIILAHFTQPHTGDTERKGPT
jgi:hypothetical protein